MKKKDFITIIENIAPLALAEDWDNSGVQILIGGDEVKRVLVCLDVCRDTVDEAVANNCDFIVSHHPLFFGGVKRIDAGTAEGELVIRLIENGISVYSAHTSFDAAEGGNNDFLAELLGLSNVKAPEEEPVMRVGEYISGDSVTLKDVIQIVDRTMMKGSGVNYAGDPGKIIRKVALCTGAGADFIDTAIGLGCDLLVTGDVKYHEFQMAENKGLALIDAGHYETEIFFCDNMGLALASKAGNDVIVIPSKAQHNPLRRYHE